MTCLKECRPRRLGRVGERRCRGPWIAGHLGVLAHHAALVTGLAQGTLTLRVSGGETQRREVNGGFFEVSNNRATVLADGVGVGSTKA